MDQDKRNYEGIEIGAVSVKWARLSSEEMIAFEVIGQSTQTARDSCRPSKKGTED